MLTEKYIHSGKLGEVAFNYASDLTLTHQIKLGIYTLRDHAFADIKNKVSLDNVVDEVFSWVTAR